jgi:hypothetical protein
MTELLWPATVILVAALMYSGYLKTITKKRVDELSDLQSRLEQIEAKVADLTISKTMGRY